MTAGPNDPHRAAGPACSSGERARLAELAAEVAALRAEIAALRSERGR